MPLYHQEPYHECDHEAQGSYLFLLDDGPRSPPWFFLALEVSLDQLDLLGPRLDLQLEQLQSLVSAQHHVLDLGHHLVRSKYRMDTRRNHHEFLVDLDLDLILDLVLDLAH